MHPNKSSFVWYLIWAKLHLYLEPNGIWVQDEIVFGSGKEFCSSLGLWDRGSLEKFNIFWLRFFDWTIEWLNDWLFHWLTDHFVYWLFVWLYEWLFGCLNDWLADWVIHRLIDSGTFTSLQNLVNLRIKFRKKFYNILPLSFPHHILPGITVLGWIALHMAVV